jgi:DNA-binding transcriptional MerR regulator
VRSIGWRPMTDQWTIGELAAAAGVPSSTIRFYERHGLMEADRRSESGYRLYGPQALERLRFIRAAQATGFTLEDVLGLLGRRPDEPSACHEVRVLLELRLKDVRARLDGLREVEAMLVRSLAACIDGGRERCSVLMELKVTAAGERRSETLS